jgi:beta-lactam-binding protein with PASTA domain
MNIEEIEPRLTELGFDVKIVKIEEGNYDDGEIIGIGLATGKKYKKGTTVTLRVYSEPPEPETDEFGEPVTDEDGNIVYVTEPVTESED